MPTVLVGHEEKTVGRNREVEKDQIFSPWLALMRRAQRIEREVSEAEEARAACAPGSIWGAMAI